LPAYVRRTYIVSAWRRRGASGTLGRTPRIKRKHGISFEEARTVFADEYALLLDDPDHSTDDERFILHGLSAAFRVLVVVHTYRRPDDTIRILSARKATKREPLRGLPASSCTSATRLEAVGVS
jgi:uncharacterized DUF497 family protein